MIFSAKEVFFSVEKTGAGCWVLTREIAGAAGRSSDEGGVKKEDVDRRGVWFKIVGLFGVLIDVLLSNVIS
jgi:hypothetical protein